MADEYQAYIYVVTDGKTDGLRLCGCFSLLLFRHLICGSRFDFVQAHDQVTSRDQFAMGYVVFQSIDHVESLDKAHLGFV